MPTTVRELDRTDERWLRAYWELAAASTASLPHDFWPAWEWARVAWAQSPPDRRLVFLGAFDGDGSGAGGRMVGGAWLGLGLVEDTRLGWFELHVAPDARRAGHGTALLAAVEAVARDAGRTTYLTDTVVPLGGVSPGEAFGLAAGYVRAGVDEAKVADLSATGADLARLGAQAAERSGGYDLLVVEGRVPEELVADLCALLTRFRGEIPLEDVDLGAQVWTPERLREAEARHEAAGRRTLWVLARAAGGGLVGHSEVRVLEATPGTAEVASTLVLPEHRGHRLGLALKVRLHAELRERGVRTVLTHNAGVNDHMNAVNELLGYRVAQHVVALQKKV